MAVSVGDYLLGGRCFKKQEKKERKSQCLKNKTHFTSIVTLATQFNTLSFLEYYF